MTTIILGPPGCGKTETCLRTVDEYLKAGVAPDRIGYFAFTRRANREAVERARKNFKLDYEDLPYFKTLHSLAFSQLGITRGQIMGRMDYEIVSQEYKTDKFFITADMQGYADKCLSLISYARATMKPLELVYAGSHSRHSVSWQTLDYVNRALKDYKRRYDKFDYTDILEQFVQRDVAPRLDVLVLDESQDLSTLQWEMVRRIAKKADDIFIAGDDDQAIYRWAGADVEQFVGLPGDTLVLDQSYRIPASHHRMSQVLINRIIHRRKKPFNPRDALGTVDWYTGSDQVDISHGEWLLLARTVKGTDQLETEVRRRGHLYSYEKKRLRGNEDMLEAVMLWEKLRSGSYLSTEEVRKVYKCMLKHTQVAYGHKGMPKCGDDAYFCMTDLLAHHGLLTTAPWDQALGALADDERYYIKACLRKGEKLTGTPRIIISTIHGAKGAQADNVLLLTDSVREGRNGDWANVKTVDDETRTFYVGLTRAKQSLHLIHPMYSKGFQLPV